MFVEQPQGYEKKVKSTRCIDGRRQYMALNKPQVYGTVELKHILLKDLRGVTMTILYSYQQEIKVKV